MKKALPVIFWILTDLLIILSIVLFPSVFSVFSIIAAVIFAPIEEWQDLIKKYIKKPFRSIIIAISVAFVIALFPFSEVIIGLNRLKMDSNPSENNSIIYNEEYSNTSSSSDFFVIDPSSNSENSNVSNITSENISTSSKQNSLTTSGQSASSSKPNSQKTETSSKDEQTTSIKTNGDTVYRTPSGKKYHKSPTCGGKNSYEVSLNDAKNSGLEPCKKCAE